MKVFVVIGWWHHGNCDDPIGVFSSREKAEACLKGMAAGPKRSPGYDGEEILEYDLDAVLIKGKGASITIEPGGSIEVGGDASIRFGDGSIAFKVG